jgi:hypothetical protein
MVVCFGGITFGRSVMTEPTSEEQDVQNLRERNKTASRVLAAVTDALPEGRPVPHQAVWGLAILVQSLLEGD